MVRVYRGLYLMDSLNFGHLPTLWIASAHLLTRLIYWKYYKPTTIYLLFKVIWQSIFPITFISPFICQNYNHWSILGSGKFLSGLDSEFTPKLDTQRRYLYSPSQSTFIPSKEQPWLYFLNCQQWFWCCEKILPRLLRSNKRKKKYA